MMEIAQQTRPSLWFALIWKDFQQVKSTFIAVLAGVFVVQLLLLVSASFAQNADTRTGLLSVTVTFACVAPILLALGCSGMLIGHERQSGTWTWSSSLPASWRLALSSKLLVSTIGSLCASLPLAIIPVALLITGQLLIPESANVTLATFYISSMTIVVFFEVIVFCFLTTVLLRETLTALVVAAIGLLIVQISMGAWLSHSAIAFLVRNGVLPEQAEPIVIAIFVGAVLSIGCVLMVGAFRWRWGIGQQATLTFWRSASSVRLPSNVRYRYAEGIAPSEWKMMLRLSCANSFWLRLIVVAGAFFLFATATAAPEAVLTIALLAACILGVTAFEGDQTLSRFRFLADRGVVPWKLVASRLVVVAVLVLITTIVSLVRFPAPMDRIAFGLGLGPMALLIGAFSSMCFRKSVIAVAAALVASLVAFFVSASIINLVLSDVSSLIGQQPFTDFNWIVLYCSPVAVVALLAALFRLSRRWLVLDDAKLEPHFVWISLTALLSPLFVACTFGFLLIPNVSWPRDPVLQFSLERVLFPGPLVLNEPILTDTLPRMSILSRSRGRGMEGVADSANDAVGQVRVDLAAQLIASENNLVAVVEPLLKQFEELTRRPRQQQIGVYTGYSVPQLENLIARTAALATVAMGQDESELALRIWRLNREFQELAHQFNPLHTHASRNVAMHLLGQVSDLGVAAMGGPDVFRSLIPTVPDERIAIMKESRENAINHREMLRGNIAVLSRNTLGSRSKFIHCYPPLRWLFERQIAVDLDRQLNSTKELSANFLTGESRASLIARYP